jgi:hypothetical protein
MLDSLGIGARWGSFLALINASMAFATCTYAGTGEYGSTTLVTLGGLNDYERSGTS